MTGHEASRCLSHSYGVSLKVVDLFLDPDECEQMFVNDSQLTSRDRGGCRQTFSACISVLMWQRRAVISQSCRDDDRESRGPARLMLRGRYSHLCYGEAAVFHVPRWIWNLWLSFSKHKITKHPAQRVASSFSCFTRSSPPPNKSVIG